ncbi:MAG: hypothetical protein KJ856_00285 [Gammaproteobacteria bacterium]|nr:hypothetical protein [Gammaproteobacteria bacterium]MBU1479696.1 hypothetical protein [Gammaproteobacteria bacterium]MBU1999726.1 hypothetical protein [Gammaproteobacteria bacterium]MBU2133091.1 hypothetical protein [Gammaproteobacteria bacterium]MBU2185467.1 hypothetical protein [Gammaproteobacteria bacterium]
MPLFVKRNRTYIGALQCGAGRDAYLEFELAESNELEPELYTTAPMKYSLSEGVDPLEIKKAALRGAQMCNEKYGTNFSFKKIGYVPNDSKYYELHTRVAYIVLERIFEGGEFAVSSAKG